MEKRTRVEIIRLIQDIILTFIVFLIRFFISIGDAVRFFFRVLYILPLKTYNALCFVLIKVIKPLFFTTYVPKEEFKQYNKPILQKKPFRSIIDRLYVTGIKNRFIKTLTYLTGIYHNLSDRILHIIKDAHTSYLARMTESIERLMKKREKAQELMKLRSSQTHKQLLAIRQYLRLPEKTGRHISVSSVEQAKSFIAGVAVTILFFFFPVSAYQWLNSLPNPKLLSLRDVEVTTKIFDRNGILLYEVYTNQNRTPLSLKEIPIYVKNATIAIEDKNFYKHQGISLSGITRAARETLLNNKIQGGSTITQQLIKSALLTPEVTITRKIKEIVLAFWAERLYSKNQIVEMYLNQVPYGGTAWGIEAASQTYFGKSVKDISLAEAALLAGLPAAPTEYSPFGNHPEKAYERMREVLRRMSEDRYITKDEEQKALSTKIVLAQRKISIRAPHFVMYVKNLLEQRYGARLVDQGGLRVTTSLDSSIQDTAQEILKNSVDSLASLGVGNGAAMVTNPKTGEILAMVGSKDYFDLEDQGNVNVTLSLRPPGSSIKVVNYAAALENGFTAATVLDDSPIVYTFAGSPPYAPVNYDGKFHGFVPLLYAFANSYNIPAVKTLARIGVHTMIEKGKLMGITTWNDESRYGLSLTLGGGDVTMLDMTKVFGTLANKGTRVDLMPILEVSDYTGHILERHKTGNAVQAVKPDVVWILGNILSDNNARTAAFGPNSNLVISGKTVSVKT